MTSQHEIIGHKQTAVLHHPVNKQTCAIMGKQLGYT